MIGFTRASGRLLNSRNSIRMKLKGILVTLVVVLLGVVAAGAEAKEPVVDRSDPASVAKAFIAALANERFDEAVELVILEDREDFRKAVTKGIPKLPNKPKVVVRLEKDGKRAGADLSNPKPRAEGGRPFGFNLELVDGKWWIAK